MFLKAFVQIILKMPDIFKCSELSASECQGGAAISYWQQGQSFISRTTLNVLKLNVRVGAFSEKTITQR